MLRRGLLGYLPVNIVQALAGFGSIIIFTRLLSPSDYGAYALAFSVTSLVYLACLTWIEAAMARFYVAETTEAGRADLQATLYRTFGVMMFAAPVICGVIVTVLPISIELKLAIAAGLASVVFRSLLKLAQERRRAAGEVRGFAVYDIVQTGAGFLIGTALAFAGIGAASPLAGAGAASAICLVWALPGELKVARQGAFERRRLIQYAAYGLPVSMSLMMSLALATTDRFVLAGYLNEAAVGAYHAGYSLSNRTLDVMFIWLGMAGQPACIAALERGGREALKKTATDQASMMILVALPASVGLMLVAGPLAPHHGRAGPGGQGGHRHPLDRRRRLPLRHDHLLLQHRLHPGAPHSAPVHRHRHPGGGQPRARAGPGAAIRPERRHVGDGRELRHRHGLLHRPGAEGHPAAHPMGHPRQGRGRRRRHGAGCVAPAELGRRGRASAEIHGGRGGLRPRHPHDRCGRRPWPRPCNPLHRARSRIGHGTLR